MDKTETGAATLSSAAAAATLQGILGNNDGGTITFNQASAPITAIHKGDTTLSQIEIARPMVKCIINQQEAGNGALEISTSVPDHRVEIEAMGDGSTSVTIAPDSAE